MIKPEVNYLNFRFSKISTPEFKHTKLVIFWPIFGIVFASLERFVARDSYYSVYCPLDDKIPFCEFFIIPYMFWFIYLVGMYLYTAFYDVECFTKLMQFTIITYTVAAVTYIVFPTMQELRPESFERDNFLTRFIANFYNFDTNTNVCPSIHVIGSLAVMFASWHCKHLQAVGWKIAFTFVAFLICISTVFVKQHSILDMPPAIILSVAAYIVVYYVMPKIKRMREEKRLVKAQENTPDVSEENTSDCALK